MRFFLTAALVALAAEGTVASTWFGKAAYNKWHETELERWLSDHNVKYPTPADRKDLVDLVNKNWEDNVATPYTSWDANQLQAYLTSQGQQAKKGTEKNKDALVQQVKANWHETAESSSSAFSSIQDWIFDTWTESQLKSFLDYHGIPNPTPRTRDSLLSSARSNYQSAANKAGETAAYPGDWLYQSWSDSDLKAWLDERGIPAPQPSSRDKLVASLRRNARVGSTSASNKASEAASSVSSGAAAASQSLTDQLLNSWSDSQIKEWADKNGIKVPQGSNRNELLALARKYGSKLTGDNAASSASSYYGAATSSAGNQYGQATNDLYSQGKQWYDWALAQVGMGSNEAKSSVSSAASSVSSAASSLSSQASKSASSASSSASKSGGDPSKAAKSAMSEASASAKSAASSAKQEL